jgi:hypothetical protein
VATRIVFARLADGGHRHDHQDQDEGDHGFGREHPLGWAPYRAPGDRSASGHIVSLSHPAATAGQVQAALASQHNIHTSSRAGGIRVSLHAYNSSDDIHALTRALASAGPR